MSIPTLTMYAEARQWSSGKADEFLAWLGSDRFEPVDRGQPWEDDPDATASLRDDSRGGSWRFLSDGDWVFLSVHGATYPMSARVHDDLFGAPFVERGEREGEVIDFTARLLAALVNKPGGAELVRESLPAVLPWSKFLPAEAVEELVTEFVATASAAASIHNTAPISQLLTEWRHTAEIYADPELHAVLSRPIEGV